MSFAKRGLRLLLALLLVFSQQQATLHLLGHDLSRLVAVASAPSSPDSGGDPQELVCAKCLVVAHLDHVVTVDVPRVDAIRATPDLVAPVAPASRDLPFVPRYRSRAPPVLS